MAFKRNIKIERFEWPFAGGMARPGTFSSKPTLTDVHLVSSSLNTDRSTAPPRSDPELRHDRFVSLRDFEFSDEKSGHGNSAENVEMVVGVGLKHCAM